MKQILFDKEARTALLEGVDLLGDAVRTTLGPKGKAVLINPENPTWTRDGVTVANEIELEPGTPQNSGARIIRSVARKTNQEAGDGTTTASILTQELTREGMKGVEIGIDPFRMRQAWKDMSPLIIKELNKNARKVKGKTDVASAATISSRSKEMGNIIAEVYDKIGEDGVISVEGTNTVGLFQEIVDGMEVDKGWIAPHFMTNPERGEAVVENPYILVTSQSIGMNDDIVRALEAVANTKERALVIFCDDMRGEALVTAIQNKLGGVLKMIVVRAPESGDTKTDMLGDIAVLTGATLLSEDTGTRMDAIDIDDMSKDFGMADKVYAFKDKTIIVGGKGRKADIEGRINLLKYQIGKEESRWRKETLKKRHARLSGGVGVIRIGCVSEQEQRDKRYLLEDAVNTARSAIKEGIVIGGGLALYSASKMLDVRIKRTTDPDYRFGLQALQKAIQAPARQVLINAGYIPEVILDDFAVDGIKGFNADNGEWVDDMFKAGIIDPLKVERVALENSISVVGMFLITGTVISDKKEEHVDAKKDL